MFKFLKEIKDLICRASLEVMNFVDSLVTLRSKTLGCLDQHLFRETRNCVWKICAKEKLIKQLFSGRTLFDESQANKEIGQWHRTRGAIPSSGGEPDRDPASTKET